MNLLFWTALLQTIITVPTANLGWDPSPGATGYNIYQSIGAGPFAVAKSATASPAGVPGLVNGGYRWYVTATAPGIESAPSNIVAATVALALPPPPQDTTAPILSGGFPSGSLPSGTTQIQFGLVTNEPANCRYHGSASVAYASMVAMGATGGTSHSSISGGLTDGLSQTFYVRCQDIAGNEGGQLSIAYSVATVPVPPPAPTLQFSATPTAIIFGQSSTLTWTSSNADSVSISGLGTVSVSGSNAVSPAFTTSYTATATGAGGNVSASVTVSVTQPTPPPPQVTAIESWLCSVTSTTAEICWTTPLPTDGKVEYGVVPAFTRVTTSEPATRRVTSHLAKLASLTTKTIYNWRVTSVSADGTMYSGSGVFTTK